MNIDQSEIVIQYLKIETNYAVIINGQYGIGKTHFYKNELVPKIKKVSSSKDETKKFTPVHISLFGFKSLEEIQTAIFMELFPILKSKNIKLAAGIGKSIIRGMAHICQLGDIDKYIGDMSQDVKEYLKYDDLVICFDDLDRKSESLDLKDVFGFINSLVENEGAKILIIANEEQLNQSNDNYSSLREKVIGVSIQYRPNPKAIYSQIIQSRYSSALPTYYEFLSYSEGVIINRIEINQNNFRNLIFFLEHFKTIFYQIEGLFEADKNFLIQKDEKLQAILNFTLAISIEYKLGLLNSTNLDGLKELGENPLANINLDGLKDIEDNPFTDIDLEHPLENSADKEDETKKPRFIETFRKKYYSDKRKYYFFKSIFEYITGTKAFNLDDLKEELDKYFIIKDGKIPEQDKILNDLRYFGCLNISDKEYRKLTFKMLSFVDNGKYQLHQFGTAFHFATRFNNMLKFDFANLKKRFKDGIKKGIPNYKYNDSLGPQLIMASDTEFKNDVDEIGAHCFNTNDSLKKINKKNELDNLFNLFETDFSAFIEKAKEHQSTPFWLDFDLKKIVAKINKLDNEQVWFFGHYFTDRYRSHNINEKLYQEKDFIVNLCKQIDKPPVKRKKKNLRNASLDYFSKCLQECQRNFPGNH